MLVLWCQVVSGPNIGWPHPGCGLLINIQTWDWYQSFFTWFSKIKATPCIPLIQHVCVLIMLQMSADSCLSGTLAQGAKTKAWKSQIIWNRSRKSCQVTCMESPESWWVEIHPTALQSLKSGSDNFVIATAFKWSGKARKCVYCLYSSYL